MKIDTVYMIGCGGTGSILAEPLVRLLAFHSEGTRNITLVDGDSFEEKNQVRQLFSRAFVGKKKCVALARRIDFLNLRTLSIYLDKEALKAELLSAKEAFALEFGQKTPWMPLIISAVDNLATRADMIEALDELALPSFFYLDTGNELDYGSLQIYAQINGKRLTAHPFEIFPELKNPVDHIPGSCQDATPSSPQLISANMASATSALLTVQALLDDQPVYSSVAFNCRRIKIVPQDDNPMKVPYAKSEAKVGAA